MPRTTDDVRLRAATLDDADAVAAVLRASRLAYLTYLPVVHTADEDRHWMRHVVIPSSTVTLAVIGDDIAGVVASSQRQGFRWIDHLYLKPGYTGRGMGSLLLQHALVPLRRPVRLYAFEPNHGARRFYERKGFKAIAFEDGSDNEERCPAVLYELTH